MANTVRDLLEEVRAFHGELSGYYGACSATLSDLRPRMLLEFMAAHERELAAAMDEYETNGTASVLDSWVQSPPTLAWRGQEDEQAIRSDGSVDEVLTAVLRFHERIVGFCDQVASEPVAPRVRELFQHLRDQEMQEERLAARSAIEVEREM